MLQQTNPLVPEEILAAYHFQQATIQPVTHGNINQTFAVQQQQQQFALQRLHPVFHPEIHHVIERVTKDLLAAQLLTPTIWPLADGRLWLHDKQGHVWRCITWITGQTLQKQQVTAEHCYQAGLLLGRFHAALQNTKLPALNHARLDVHNTAQHLAMLGQAVEQHKNHPAWQQVSKLYQQLRAALSALTPLPLQPERLVHGDPKLDNIVFDTNGQAIALIDLDTIGLMPLTQELGDAWRSWCNPGGEHASEPHFDIHLLEGSLRGYAHGALHLLSATEKAALPVAAPTIALELAARFARDALEERYFGWDKTTFAHAWQHHLLRANNQWLLAQSYLAQQSSITRLLGQVLSS